MNYIKQLQTDRAETLDSTRSIETEINDLISYLCCEKFRLDTHVQVGDMLRALLPIRNTVTLITVTLSSTTINDKNK